MEIPFDHVSDLSACRPSFICGELTMIDIQAPVTVRLVSNVFIQMGMNVGVEVGVRLQVRARVMLTHVVCRGIR